LVFSQFIFYVDLLSIFLPHVRLEFSNFLIITDEMLCKVRA